MSGASPGSARNAALDGLRGYAAVAVVFYHSILGAQPRLIPAVLGAPVWAQSSPCAVAEKLALAVLNGELAVEVFFTLSGIVLFRSLRALDQGWWPRTCWSFAVRRFVRIWPAMAVAVLGTAAMSALAGLDVPGWTAIRRNLLLSEYGVIGATWTLHAELAMVPPFLACFFLTRRLGRRALIACLAYALLAFHFHALLGADRVLTYALPFAIGGAAVESGVLDRLYRSRHAAPVALASAAGAVLLFLVLPANRARLGLEVALVTAAVGWVARAPGGAVRRALEAPLSRFLGRVSYSFYLWNVPVFEVMLAALGYRLANAHPLEVGLLVGAAASVATIPLAYLSARWVEGPCIVLGRRLTGRAVPSACAAVSSSSDDRGRDPVLG
jgi:peptidoglycan/LPS O-acetylase OafA/YrhL